MSALTCRVPVVVSLWSDWEVAHFWLIYFNTVHYILKISVGSNQWVLVAQYMVFLRYLTRGLMKLNHSGSILHIVLCLLKSLSDTDFNLKDLYVWRQPRPLCAWVCVHELFRYHAACPPCASSFQTPGKFLILFSVGFLFWFGLVWFALLLSSSMLTNRSQLLTFVERHSARSAVILCVSDSLLWRAGLRLLVKVPHGCREFKS